jgi:hypothetical protein
MGERGGVPAALLQVFSANIKPGFLRSRQACVALHVVKNKTLPVSWGFCESIAKWLGHSPY